MKIRPELNTCILVLLAAVVWWLSRQIAWIGDDLDYMFRMKGAIWESWGWIRNPGEFLASQWNHYLHVNGRFVAHALVQLFNGILGQEWFAVFNALVYPATAVVLARLGGSRPLSTGALLTAIILILFGFVTKMMPTCQIGYIWGLGINMLWVGFFLSGRARKRGEVILMCISGLIAGNWQEAYSVGIGAAMGVILLTQWMRHPIRRIPPDRQLMATAYILGTASVCLAPSTLSRAAVITAGNGEMAMVSPPGWLYAVLSLRLFYIFVLLIIWRLISARRISTDHQPFRLRSFLYSQSLWVAAMAFLIIFNLAVGVFGNRQLFGIEMCSAVMILRLLRGHKFNRLWTTVGCIGVTVLYSWQYSLAMEARRQFGEIERLYIGSEDGRVYFDRQRATNEGFTREIRIYEDVVGLYDNDPHHSMMKYLRHRHKHRRPLLVIPTGVRTLEFKDTIWSYAPGHYVAIGKQGDTVLMLSGGLLKEIERPYDFHKALKGPEDWRILQITPTDPWRTPRRPSDRLS